MKEIFIKADKDTLEYIANADRSYTATYMEDEDASKKRLDGLKGKGIDPGIDDYKSKNSFVIGSQEGLKVYTIQKSGEYEKILFYLHGGAYTYGIYDWQMDWVDDVVFKTGIKAVVPLYKTAPDFTYKDTFETLYRIYIELLKENKEVTVSGDSAGGGLSTAFMHYLVDKGAKLPDKLVLHSPWIDVTTVNKYIDLYKFTDLMLPTTFLRQCGEAWAGDKSVYDYLISPLYGKFNKMPKTLLFTSTGESFYPDNYALAQKMNSEGTDVTFVTIEEGFHVISVMGDLKEGQEARQIAIDFMME